MSKLDWDKARQHRQMSHEPSATEVRASTKEMKARFDGECEVCSRPIKAGMWIKPGPVKTWVHRKCG